MVAARISPFGGMVPAVDDSLLAPINAAFVEDTWTYSGAVVGLPVRKNIYTLADPNKTKVYRVPNNYTDSLHLSDSLWLEFAHPDTDVLRTQVVGDTFDRYYWASPLDVPRYMTYAQLVAGAPALASAYILGIPQPGAISGIVSGGASATLKSVAYTQTFVSAYGEEGPPSAPKVYSGQKIDATYTITFAQPDPGDLGTNRNITKMRLYRTITATNGTTTYFFVTEVAVGTVSYADNAAVNTDAVIGLNAQIESTNWSGPPSDLQGWVSMTNGIVAGFRNNEIWFCEPYRMHAWPAIYTLAVEYPIVGLGVQSNALVVCTDGFAYTINGAHPSSMSLQKIAGLMPCTSRGSILSTTDGVYFSTPAGLALVAAGTVVIATKELIRKDKWNALVQINTLRAAQLGPAYYAFGQAVLGVFQTDTFQNNMVQLTDFGGARAGMLIDPTSQTVAFNNLTTDDPITNVMTDVWSGEIFVIQNGMVQWLDISDTQQTKAPWVWRSKIFQTAKKDNFNVGKVFFTVPPNTVSLNPVEVFGLNQTLQADQWGLFRAYADGVLIMTREIRVSGEQFRLPSGFKADFWQFEIEARVQVDVMQIATSAAELAAV
jgi:hypothetical protein